MADAEPASKETVLKHQDISDDAPDPTAPKSDTGGPDEEKALPSELEAEPAPDGGRTAWLVAAGSATSFFCCLGFANSFGAFEEYYLAHPLRGQSSEKVAWIGSLAIFFQFAGGAVGGPLFDRYGAWTFRPAAVTYVFGVMMLSISKKYWHFMLTQGVLMGLSMGLLQFPAFAAVSQWFDKKRAAALGIAVSGSSLGGVVIPIAVSKMLNSSSLGFGWTVRIIGFLIIPLLAFSCLVMKPRLPPRKSNFVIWAAYKDLRFLVLIAAMFFSFIAMFAPLFYLPSFAVTLGMNPTLAGYMLALLNSASTFGRIIPGILGDKYGRLNAFAFGSFGTGIVIFCLHSVKSNAGVIVYSLAIGFTSGSIISASSAALSLCVKDVRDMGTYLGMAMLVASTSALIGPPVNGVLIDEAHGFLKMSLFSGVSSIVGGILVLIVKTTTPEGIFGKI